MYVPTPALPKGEGKAVGKTLSVILNLFQELIFSLSQYVKIFVRRADSLKVESQKSKVSQGH